MQAVEELLEVSLVEPQQLKLAPGGAELGDQRSEVLLQPLTPLRVVAQGAFFRQLFGDVHQHGGDALPAQMLGCAVAHVAGEDGAVLRREDGPQPEELRVGFQRAAEVLEALVLDRPGVPRGGRECDERDELRADRAAGLGRHAVLRECKERRPLRVRRSWRSLEPVNSSV
jgi:hypothetical protein